MPEQYLPAAILADATACLTTHGIQAPRLDAEVLLGHVLGISRTALYARLKTPLSPECVDRFWQLIVRRADREPLQYITGIQEFWSLEFSVDRRVLIPRPETELVIEVGLKHLRNASASHSQAIRILDIGTGSGCLAISLAKELPHAHIWATDISADALAVARANALRHCVSERICFIQTDLWPASPTAPAGFDLIVANPPYIARPELRDLQPEVQDWEPYLALNGGQDGLDFYRRLLQDCLGQLCIDGWLVMEIGAGQKDAVLCLIAQQATLTHSLCQDDYAGHPRVICARRPNHLN